MESNSKINTKRQKEIGHLPTFKLLSQDTNDMIRKTVDPENLEKDVSFSNNDNMIIIYGDNNNQNLEEEDYNLEEDCDVAEGVKCIDEKKNDHKSEKNGHHTKKEESKPKKKYTRNFYNRCYPNKIIT
ncbi:hypothetical protein LIER_04108 [Lithospermum erythrorhizon]|uniref:Uncharacterized protein n=1 Tax=Lithospermum erythrorhizon TaxID=34254 RepID=A0AAV3NVZ8_LITER